MAVGFQVTFDAADPMQLAGFWAKALGYVMQPPPEGFSSWESFADAVGIPVEERDRLAAIVDPRGERPRLLFQKVPEGKTAKNRVHLDVNVGEGTVGDERKATVESEAERLAGLGGTVVRRFDEPREFWIVMQDPEGNEFCLQ